MRRFLSPRWLALHALMVLAFCGCLGMCWWQLTRAQGGNTLSWGYTFEWPVFGVFAVAFWGKLIRDERRRTEPEQPTRLSAPVLAGARPPAEPERIRRVERAAPVEDTRDDPELAAYNDYLTWQNANPHRSRRDYPGRPTTYEGS
ncbi:hypothetical protein [Actinocatenispora rupis]|uniref:DNA-binding transcriptional regulator of glucitol operon n=1 Tax=Actinocatenispora rupis TaxID=519421 RepID=A0A8J3J4Z7_9ACTN|nr:hypothetical protein [Actinocatenispora rupis]GID15881.1 hypothetical protein Aru02nite_67700 [Actinocatenispora rupis]